MHRETTSRAPKPESFVAKVLPYLHADQPNPPTREIAQKTGLPEQQVQGARKRAFRDHYLPTPSAENRSESISIARGSIWSEIERYAKMRLTPREIELALELEGKHPLPYSKIENGLNKAWKRGLLKRRTPEERTQSRLDSINLTPERLQVRTSLWLEAASQTEEHPEELRPRTRLDWLEKIEDLEREKRKKEEEVKERQEQEKLETLRSVLVKPELVPEDPNQREYLSLIIEARKAWQAGDRDLLDNFPTHFEEEDPDITSKLVTQLKTIRDATQKSNQIDSSRIRSAIAEHSEPDKQ